MRQRACVLVHFGAVVVADLFRVFVLLRLLIAGFFRRIYGGMKRMMTKKSVSNPLPNI